MPTQEERNTLAKMCHPFVVRLHYGFQTENTFYLIMDYFRGGDIFTNLCKKVYYYYTRILFKNSCNGIKFY